MGPFFGGRQAELLALINSWSQLWDCVLLLKLTSCPRDQSMPRAKVSLGTKCAVCSVQRKDCSLQCAVYGVQCSVCSKQCAVCSVCGLLCVELTCPLGLQAVWKLQTVLNRAQVQGTFPYLLSLICISAQLSNIHRWRHAYSLQQPANYSS